MSMTSLILNRTSKTGRKSLRLKLITEEEEGMRKICSVILAGIVTAGLLTGCGSTSAADSYMGVAGPADDIAYDSAVNSAGAAEPPVLEEKAYTDDYDAGAEPADELAAAEEMVPDSGGMAVSETSRGDGGLNGMAGSGSGGNTTVTFDADRKLIYHSTVVLETLDYDRTYAQLLQILGKYGGYIQSESYVNDNGSYLNRDHKGEGLVVYSSNDICVRVPRKDYFNFMEDGLSLGNIVSKSQNVEDKTADYATNQSYIEIQNKKLEYYDSQLDKLDKELTKAIEDNDTVRFDQILRDMEYMSDMKASVENSLIPYKSHNEEIDAESSYATINMTIREVKEYTKPVIEPERELTFGERVDEAFERSWLRFISWAEFLIILMIDLLPVFLIFAIPAAIILAVVLIIRQIGRHHKKKTPGTKAATADSEMEQGRTDA